MKIVFVVPEISKTGGMRIIFEYANKLSDKGYDVTVASPVVPLNSFKGKFSLYFFRYRLNYARRFLTGKIENPKSFFDVKFKIKYIPYPSVYFLPEADVYIATSWTSSYLVSKVKAKKFYLIQDYEIWTSNIVMVDKSYKLPLKKIVVSTYLKNLLKDKFNEDSDVVLNGIDFTKFNNEDKTSFSVKTVLFMDHSLKNKNVEDALSVVDRLHSNHPGIKFICFGRNMYSNIPDYVEFYNDPSDEMIASLYKRSDIFLYTSMYEGFALPPAEAMACKCAVAGYNTAGLPDFAINNETALLCEAGEVNALYENVKKLIQDPKLLEKISLNGYSHIRKVLEWNDSFIKFEKIILS